MTRIISLNKACCYFISVLFLNDYSDALEPGVSTLADFWAHEAEGVLWDVLPADDDASALEVLPP